MIVRKSWKLGKCINKPLPDLKLREVLKTDTLLGVGSIPLAPLLQETFIDRVAPVYAVVKMQRQENLLNNQVVSKPLAANTAPP